MPWTTSVSKCTCLPARCGSWPRFATPIRSVSRTSWSVTTSTWSSATLAVTTSCTCSVCVVWVFIKPDDCRELGEGAERLIYEKSYLEAVSCMKRTTSTVQRSAENWQIYQIPLCSLVFKIFTEVAEALQSHLQRTDINVASEVMKSFVRSECHSVQASKAGDELSFRSDKTKAVQALRELQRQMIGLLVPGEATPTHSLSRPTGNLSCNSIRSSSFSWIESTDRGNLRTKRDVHRLQSLLNKRKRLTRLKRQEFEQGDPVWDSPILNFIDSLFNSEQVRFVSDLNLVQQPFFIPLAGYLVGDG